MTQSLIVCFTLKCWCMAAVVNVKIQATECGNANTCQSLKIFSLIEELHGSDFCGRTTEICSGNSALFILFGPNLNVSCKAICESLSFVLVWAIFAFPCQFRLNSWDDPNFGMLLVLPLLLVHFMVLAVYLPLYAVYLPLFAVNTLAFLRMNLMYMCTYVCDRTCESASNVCCLQSWFSG